MEAGESDVDIGRRKRTDSNSANSDSDLSDGWNIVDHLDAHNPDVPSSDGESVEVIDGESSDHCHDEEEEVEEDGRLEGERNQLLLKPETPVVLADQLEPPVLAESPRDPPREEMFDSSFCWFLFFATSAVLASNLAYMAAESVFDWNGGVMTYVTQPSFLKDLPVTPKTQQQDHLQSNTAWTNEEEVNVEIVDKSRETFIKTPGKSTKKSFNGDRKYSNSIKENLQRFSLKIDNQDFGKYFRDLSDVTVSNEAQNKFSQTLLILDALQIGLNDLESVVAESSELHGVLKKQKETLASVLTEIQSGVSRSMEKMAVNVLDKVQRLERSFENQWCRLEKSGHKDELKGLFYDCEESEGKENKYDQRNQFQEKSEKKNRMRKESYQYEVDRDSAGKEYNRPNRNHNGHDDYYRMVKDEKRINDKLEEENKNKFEYSESHNNLAGDLKSDFKYEKPVKVDKTNEYKNDHKQSNFEKNSKHENSRNNYNNKKTDDKQHQKDTKYSGKSTDKEYFDTIEKSERNEPVRPQDQNSKENEKYNKQEYNKQTGQDILKGERPEKNEHERFKEKNFPKYGKSEKYEKSNENEKFIKYEKSREHYSNRDKFDSNENKFKEGITQGDFSHQNGFKKESNEHSKSDRSENEKNGYSQKWESNNFIKSAAEKLGKYLKEKCEKNKQKTVDIYNKLKEKVKEKVRVPIEMFNNMYNKYCSSNKETHKKDNHKKEQLKGEYNRNSYDRRQFLKDDLKMFQETRQIKIAMEFKNRDSLEENEIPVRENVLEPSHKPHQWEFVFEKFSSNNSNIDGDWFTKAGESRSKARWSRRRGDWWFERASHRRGNPHPSPNHWFAGSNKNWFFRRAWAREQCRKSPDGTWCYMTQDETVTIPGSSFS